jgi:hypothetical protein
MPHIVMKPVEIRADDAREPSRAGAWMTVLLPPSARACPEPSVHGSIRHLRIGG